MNIKQTISTRHPFAWMALVMLLALVLAACGGQTSSGATTPTAAPPAPTAQPTTGPGSSSATQPAATPVAASTAVTTQKFNLNTITAEQILKIPNTGNNMVREFMEYRPYTSILQFRREIGKYVSAQQVAEYEKYVYVPISVNSTDADTLQQIPGVDKTIAAQLIAARPYASNNVFLQALAKFVSADNVAVAKTYLVAS